MLSTTLRVQVSSGSTERIGDPRGLRQVCPNKRTVSAVFRLRTACPPAADTLLGQTNFSVGPRCPDGDVSPSENPTQCAKIPRRASPALAFGNTFIGAGIRKVNNWNVFLIQATSVTTTIRSQLRRTHPNQLTAPELIQSKSAYCASCQNYILTRNLAPKTCKGLFRKD